MAKKYKATIYKIYKIDDPLKYSNSVLYYYFDMEGNYIKRYGDFGKSVAQHSITETEILNKYSKILDIYYKVELCSNTVISFIETKEEAIEIAKRWTDLNNLK